VSAYRNTRYEIAGGGERLPTPKVPLFAFTGVGGNMAVWRTDWALSRLKARASPPAAQDPRGIIKRRTREDK
jgi:hypothetical protein